MPLPIFGAICAVVGAITLFQAAVNCVGTAMLAVAADAAFSQNTSLPMSFRNVSVSVNQTEVDLLARIESPTPATAGLSPVLNVPNSTPLIINGEVVVDPEVIELHYKKKAETERLVAEAAALAARPWSQRIFDCTKSLWDYVKEGYPWPTSTGVYTITLPSMICLLTACSVQFIRFLCLIKDTDLGDSCRKVGYCLPSDRPSCFDAVTTVIAGRLGKWVVNTIMVGYLALSIMCINFRAHQKTINTGEWMFGLFGGLVDMGRSLATWEWLKTAVFTSMGGGLIIARKVMVSLIVDGIHWLFGINCLCCCSRIRSAKKECDNEAAKPIKVDTAAAADSTPPALTIAARIEAIERCMALTAKHHNLVAALPPSAVQRQDSMNSGREAVNPVTGHTYAAESQRILTRANTRRQLVRTMSGVQHALGLDQVD